MTQIYNEVFSHKNIYNTFKKNIYKLINNFNTIINNFNDEIGSKNCKWWFSVVISCRRSGETMAYREANKITMNNKATLLQN